MADKVIDNAMERLRWAAKSLGYTLDSDMEELLLPSFCQYTATGYDFGSAFRASVEQVLPYLKQESR